MPEDECRTRRPGYRAFFAVILLSVLMCAVFIPGQPPLARAEEEEPEAADVLISAQQIEDSVNRALVGNQAELADLEAQLSELDSLQAVIRTEIKANESQNAAHGQLLLTTGLPIGDLEKALSENRLASKILTDRMASFQKRHDAIAIMIQASNDRRGLARQQIANIGQSQFSDEEKQRLEANTRKLIQVLDRKKELGERYLQISGELLALAKGAVEEKILIAQQLATRLATKKKASFFSRTDPLRYFSWPAVQEALRSLGSRVGMVYNPSVWKAQWSQIQGLQKQETS